jgi:hypothetical protein
VTRREESGRVDHSHELLSDAVYEGSIAGDLRSPNRRTRETAGCSGTIWAPGRRWCSLPVCRPCSRRPALLLRPVAGTEQKQERRRARPTRRPVVRDRGSLVAADRSGCASSHQRQAFADDGWEHPRRWMTLRGQHSGTSGTETAVTGPRVPVGWRIAEHDLQLRGTDLGGSRHSRCECPFALSGFTRRASS